MAEAIARKIAIERGLTDIEVASAGTSAWDGAPASDGALLVGTRARLDLSAHRAQQLTREIVADADLILAMGPHHLERIEALGGGGKAYLLTDYRVARRVDRAISDPFGGELDVYRATADELEREIRRVFDRIAAERSGRVVTRLPSRLVLLGHPVDHSLSPRSRTPRCERGHSARYETLDVAARAARRALDAARAEARRRQRHDPAQGARAPRCATAHAARRARAAR